MSTDRNWMFSSKGKRKSDEYEQGVQYFLNFAYSNEEFVDNGNIRCPCSGCKNLYWKTRDTVKIHLKQNGFVRGYIKWTSHGEGVIESDGEGSSRSLNEEDFGMEDMVRDVAGPEFDWGAQFNDQQPNSDAQGFYDLLQAAEEPVFAGCKTYTKLSAMCELFNIKSDYNMPESCYDRVTAMMKRLMPEDDLLPKNFYKTKRELAKLGLEYKRIHACKNHCMLYYKENEHRQECSVCHHPRYKPRKRRSRKKVPYKVLHYLPITPRLKRLYMSPHTAEQMTWHTKKTEEGVMGHPAHSEAWMDFNKTHKTFADEPRNVRIGLCTDGFSPFNNFNSGYSCWPVIIAVYNLPPGMSMQEPYLFLSLVIPGPDGPGKSLDVYLRPLIDELKMLWNDGVTTYDVSKKENFNMRVALLWTISDFPAYGMLSGWSTHGTRACPYCMEHTKSFWLKNGGKPCWFGCHRQFLPEGHPFREDKKNFKKGENDNETAPPLFSGEEVKRRVDKLPDIKFGNKSGKQKIDGFGKDHNWIKKSIFWELPYWHTNLIRHNLDFMHNEKNVFDNVFYTMLDVKDRTKDNPKARQDMAILCDRPGLDLVYDEKKKPWKPKAPYALTKDQVKRVCSWTQDLRFPDGYVSNLSKRVNDNDQFSGLKSHDCHVFMQRLLPIAFHDLLPKPIWVTLTDLSHFFRDMSSPVIRVKDMEQLQKNIAEILCNLERIFPPGFFDSMEHLLVHLPYEAKIGGPVQYRWMYPFERFLGRLKKKVTNRNKVEASIVNAYLNEEVSRFCSLYFQPSVQTKLNRAPRNDDGGLVDSSGSISIFSQSGRGLRSRTKKTYRWLSEDECNSAHRYILMNCAEINPLIEEFIDDVKKKRPKISYNELIKLRDRDFPGWLWKYVNNPENNVDQKLKSLAAGPSKRVKVHNGYFVNGFKFHTTQYAEDRETSNNGVYVLGSSNEADVTDYYGMVDDIMELDFFGDKVVLFKCRWFDTCSRNGIRPLHHRFDLVEVNVESRLKSNDHFILAEQAYQVYYTSCPERELRRGKGDWKVACKVKARSRIVVPLLDEELIVEERDDDPFHDGATSSPKNIPGEDLYEVDIQLNNNGYFEEVEPIELIVECVNESDLDEEKEEEFVDLTSEDSEDTEGAEEYSGDESDD